MTIEEMMAGFWPEWSLVKQLGKGSYGAVYEAVRTDYTMEVKSAIKVINIPDNESEVESLRADGMSMDDTRSYLNGIVQDFIGEIQLMETFKGTQNIVSVEDYQVVEHTDNVGWTIFIRMELLTPLNTEIGEGNLSEEEVIRLGLDMCSALEICSRKKVIHRDIKPENIFVNPFGDYKLGDFGVARQLENVTGALSQKGTYNYMAPEIDKGVMYDSTVDIYSLGLVLYRFLNRKMLPFLTQETALSPNARVEAVRRRLSGEPLPPPCDASPGLSQIVLRACAFEPSARFQTAREMKQALMALQSGTYNAEQAVTPIVPSMGSEASLDSTVSVRHAAPQPAADTAPQYTQQQQQQPQPKVQQQRPASPIQPQPQQQQPASTIQQPQPVGQFGPQTDPQAVRRRPEQRDAAQEIKDRLARQEAERAARTEAQRNVDKKARIPTYIIAVAILWLLLCLIGVLPRNVLVFIIGGLALTAGIVLSIIMKRKE